MAVRKTGFQLTLVSLIAISLFSCGNRNRGFKPKKLDSFTPSDVSKLTQKQKDELAQQIAAKMFLGRTAKEVQNEELLGKLYSTSANDEILSLKVTLEKDGVLNSGENLIASNEKKGDSDVVAQAATEIILGPKAAIDYRKVLVKFTSNNNGYGTSQGVGVQMGCYNKCQFLAALINRNNARVAVLLEPDMKTGNTKIVGSSLGSSFVNYQEAVDLYVASTKPESKTEPVQSQDQAEERVVKGGDTSTVRVNPTPTRPVTINRPASDSTTQPQNDTSKDYEVSSSVPMPTSTSEKQAETTVAVAGSEVPVIDLNGEPTLKDTTLADTQVTKDSSAAGNFKENLTLEDITKEFPISPAPMSGTFEKNLEIAKNLTIAFGLDFESEKSNIEESIKKMVASDLSLVVKSVQPILSDDKSPAGIKVVISTPSSMKEFVIGGQSDTALNQDQKNGKDLFFGGGVVLNQKVEGIPENQKLAVHAVGICLNDCLTLQLKLEYVVFDTQKKEVLHVFKKGLLEFKRSNSDEKYVNTYSTLLQLDENMSKLLNESLTSTQELNACFGSEITKLGYTRGQISQEQSQILNQACENQIKKVNESLGQFFDNFYEKLVETVNKQVALLKTATTAQDAKVDEAKSTTEEAQAEGDASTKKTVDDESADNAVGAQAATPLPAASDVDAATSTTQGDGATEQDSAAAASDSN